jgi:uncharacterized integral membrane protein
VVMAEESGKQNTPLRQRRVWGMPLTRLVIGAVALVYGIVFVSLNTARVRIHFVFFTVTSHLWVGLLVCLAAGALLGQAVGMYRQRARKADRPPRGSRPAA